MAIAWPAGLPAPTITGYALNPVDQTLRTDMDVGAARVRRRTLARLDMVEVAWKFTDSQMATFRTWFDTDAAGGASWFSVYLATGGGVVEREARFSGAWKARLLPGIHWQVTAKLEVRN